MKLKKIHNWNYCVVEKEEIEGDYLKNSNIEIMETSVYNTPYVIINNQSYLLIIQEEDKKC
jgi:hypothetical protein